MNPLTSITGTIISAFLLAIALFVFMGLGYVDGKGVLAIEVWFHAMAGVIWIGLLYYFNFVQVPGLAAAKADGSAAGITNHIAPRALLWFRWASVVTWLTGIAALQHLAENGAIKAFTFSDGMAVIGLGAWLGTIMLFNVWVFIWPNQKKLLGLVEASEEEKAKAARVALMASRTNTVLSVPMLMAMTGFAHGLGA